MNKVKRILLELGHVDKYDEINSIIGKKARESMYSYSFWEQKAYEYLCAHGMPSSLNVLLDGRIDAVRYVAEKYGIKRDE